MKVVLFCGGLGTRLREYSDTIPKPMAEIGFRPHGPDGEEALVALATLWLDELRATLADPTAVDPAAQLERAMRILREQPLAVVPEGFLMLGRVLVALGGLVVRYAPRVDLLGPFTDALRRANAARSAPQP